MTCLHLHNGSNLDQNKALTTRCVFLRDRILIPCIPALKISTLRKQEKAGTNVLEKLKISRCTLLYLHRYRAVINPAFPSGILRNSSNTSRRTSFDF